MGLRRRYSLGDAIVEYRMVKDARTYRRVEVIDGSAQRDAVKP